VCGKVVGFANIAAKGWVPSVTLYAMPGKRLVACREVNPDGTFEIYLAYEGQHLLDYPTAKGDVYKALDVRKGRPIKDLVVDLSINGELNTPTRQPAQIAGRHIPLGGRGSWLPYQCLAFQAFLSYWA
jgi:hypothetical protein